jgi:hypothetical protein
MKKWFLTVLFVGIVIGTFSSCVTFNIICLAIACISLLGFPPGMILAFSIMSLEDDVYDLQHDTGYGWACLIPLIFKSIPTLSWIVIITGLIKYGPSFIGR